MKRDRLCFLKDTWRPNSEKIHPELDVYERLKKHDVRYIATAIGGGDVRDPELQRTLTQRYMDDIPRPPLERFHYRLVIEELGRPLDTYELAAYMIVAVFNALRGM